MRALIQSLVGVMVLCLIGGLSLPPASARPGGGQNFRAPTRTAPSRPAPYHPPTTYRTTPVPVPVPVPVPRSSERYDSGERYSGAPTSTSSGGSALGGLIAFLFVVALILLVIWLVVRNRRSRPGVAVNQAAQARGLAALREQDPGFDPAAFAERCKATVARVNEDWVKGHMGPARRLISDGVFVRFQTQLNLLAEAGLRNVMVDWRVLHAEIVAAEADAQWDTVHVRVVGEARDADVPRDLPQAQAEAKARSAPLQRYEEVWSFLRRRGKRSKAGVPALEGQCPGCGAPLPLSDVVQCEYCKALVNSGEHDWVLAEITQPEEWSAHRAEAEVPGLPELRQRDPAVSRQELEDRASVIFWKWVEARATGQSGKLARFCVSPPTEGREGDIAELALYPARLEKVAVGSADLREIAPAAHADQDHAMVEIRWSAGVDGREPVGMVHLFVLARSAGATSKRGLSSLDCPSCGGALGESDAVICAYCGERLPGGKHEWALLAVRQGDLPSADEDEGGFMGE
jgi:predicted lipid-binding transport protein (Tim44 family)